MPTSSFVARGSELPFEDPIFKLHHEARTRRQSGEAIIDATLGVLLDDEGKLAILETATATLKDMAPEDWAAYAPISGRPDFLQAVTKNVFAAHPSVQEQVAAAATPGGTGALRLALTTFLEPGDTVLTAGYYWPPYATLCDEHDRKLHTFPMFDAQGAIDVAGFEKALDGILTAQGRALIFVNDPCHNPTGYSMSDRDWTLVSEVVERHASRGPIVLLLDAAYAGYAPTQAERAVGHLTKLAQNPDVLTLVAWSASKLFTHYGLRIGALLAISPDADERRRIGAAFNYACRGTWSNCNHGGMVACTRLLTEPALKAAVDAERDALTQVLNARVERFNETAKKVGLRYPRYEGGFFVSVFHENPAELAARLRTEGIYVVPQRTTVRIAMCAVPTGDVERLALALGGAKTSLSKVA